VLLPRAHPVGCTLKVRGTRLSNSPPTLEFGCCVLLPRAHPVGCTLKVRGTRLSNSPPTLEFGCCASGCILYECPREVKDTRLRVPQRYVCELCPRVHSYECPYGCTVNEMSLQRAVGVALGWSYSRMDCRMRIGCAYGISMALHPSKRHWLPL